MQPKQQQQCKAKLKPGRYHPSGHPLNQYKNKKKENQTAKNNFARTRRKTCKKTYTGVMFKDEEGRAKAGKARFTIARARGMNEEL